MNHLGDTNKMVSDTPRTDAGKKIVLGGVGGDWEVVHIAFSRQLERELNAANEMFRKLNIHTLNLVDRIKRLEEAGDRMAIAYEEICFDRYDDEQIANWHKAKEAKL